MDAPVLRLEKVIVISSKTSQKRCATGFKPGHVPANIVQTGAISIRYMKRENRYYKKIKLNSGKWEYLHRFIYEQVYGKIKPGYVIRFKDGDTLNCLLSNLEMVSRSENMRRNRNAKKQAESLKATWRREKLRANYGLSQITKLRLA